MLTEKIFTDKIKEFKEHATASGLNPYLLADMLAPLESAISQYFSTDIETGVSVCITALTHAQIRTGIVYKDGSSVEVDEGTKPTGYDDIRELFNVGGDMLEVSKEEFTRNVVEVTPTLEDGSQGETFYENYLVNNWTGAFSLASAYLLADLESVAKYANSVGLGNVVKSVLEPSEIESVPSLKDIARNIYFDRYYLELIQSWKLGIYVPSACKNEVAK